GSHLGIKLNSCPLFDHTPRFLEGKRRAVGTVRSHCINGVHHAENPRTKRYGKTFQTPGVAAAIEALMMREDDLRGFREERYALDEVISNLYVALHDPPFFRCEGTWFEKNSI